MLPGLAKAEIIIKKEGSLNDVVSCMFNPSQYSIENTLTYPNNSKLNGQETELQYPTNQSRKLTVTLYFDTMGPPSLLGKTAVDTGLSVPVTYWTERLVEATHPCRSGAMPTVQFLWGNQKFTGKISRLSENYTMFSPDGKPIRAKVDLTIEESEPSGSDAGFFADFAEGLTKCRTVVSGMSLATLAFEEYGSCAAWRLIAKANNIKNPLEILPGQKLKLP